MKSKKTDLSPYPCRFDPETCERLDKFAKKTGIAKSVLVRHGVKLALHDFEQENHLAFEGLKG